MSAHILQLDDTNFKLAISAATPTLVDFWAPWCGPCKAIAPILTDLAEELDGRLVVAALNVDDHGDICNEYGVRAIPSLLLFKNGKLVESHIGMADKSFIKAKLLKHLPAETLADVLKPGPMADIPPPESPVWGNPIITESERNVIVKALSELEARTLEKQPSCCPDHAEGWEIRLAKIRKLLDRFSRQ